MSAEENLRIGDVTEENARAFFEKFCGWSRIERNEDVATSDGDKGIDIAYDAFSPYIGEDKAVLVSVKSRGNKQTASPMEDMIYDLKDKVETIDDSESFYEDTLGEYHGDISQVFSGILFLRYSEFEKDHYFEHLDKIEIKDRRQKDPKSVNVLSNYRLSRFKLLKDYFNTKDGQVQFYYDIRGMHRGRNSKPKLAYSYLFSDIVFGEISDENGEPEPFVYILQRPSKKTIEFVLSAYTQGKISAKPPKYFIFGEGSTFDSERVEDRIKQVCEEINFDLNKNVEVKILASENPDYQLTSLDRFKE